MRVGILGLGTAGRLLVPAIDRHPHMELTAVADTDQDACEEVAAGRPVQICRDIEELVKIQTLDAVYVATPTPLHAEHTRIAAQAGKHVLVEKPMAIDLDQAQAMIQAAEKAGIQLLVGHSRSYDPPIRKMHEIIGEGRLGRVRMIHHIAFTDWIYRPRRPEELDSALGGGVTFRQGAHQFDVIRLLGGGLVESVRAQTCDWDPDRPVIGAHAVFLRFADGAVATAVYNGYGAFSSSELCFGIDERGFPELPEAIGAARRAFRSRPPVGDERAAKRKRAAASVKPTPPHHAMFGLTVVCCEQGDLRQSPNGVFMYTANGRTEIEVDIDQTARDSVVTEFHDAVSGKRTPIHDGRWGMANLEVCAAAIESSRMNREISLIHQVAAARP